ncbi:MAG TPA: Fur family transcriptional regulator [Candidatus Paceibacterota bacterium]
MIDSIKTQLRDSGLKATPVRQAVLALLSRSGKPFTAKEIVAKLSIKIKGLDTVTVYRTLHSFEKEGIVRSISLGKDALSYEVPSHHHHHIVCTDCSHIEDFEACAFDSLKDSVLKHSKSFTDITKHSFELFGLCKACSKR